jgi:hypothetical protein
MTPAEFWATTPRELEARTKVFERGREFVGTLYAGLQATLHNAHFRTKEGQAVFTTDMFMPGYKGPLASDKPDQSWRAFKRTAKAIHIQRTPEERAKLLQVARDFDRRSSRARAATAAGAGRDEILRIMEGAA